MPRRTLLLIFAVRLVSPGQICEPLPQQTQQDSLRNGPVYKQQVIDEYAAMLEKHPDDPRALYLHARVLVGTKTPQAVEELNRVLARDPNFALAHLVLVPIYQAANFKNPALGKSHLEAFLTACPGQFEAYHMLQRLPDTDFKRSATGRLRAQIEARNDTKALSHYPVLWTLEFEVNAPPDYPAVKATIRKDLARLRALDSIPPMIGNTLRQGYKLTDDAEGLAWADAHFPASAGQGQASGFQAAFKEWNDSHPYPQTPPGGTFPREAYEKRNKDLLDASAEWVSKYPNEVGAWQQRINALNTNRETPDSEVDRAADALLRLGTGNETLVASTFNMRNMHPDRIPELARKGIQLARNGVSSDLYAVPAATSISQQSSGYYALVSVYLKTYQLKAAESALAEWRQMLDQTKPPDSGPDVDRSQWAMHDVSYWNQVFRIAEQQGRKQDALAAYQRALASERNNRFYLEQQAKVLWFNLGGSDAGWQDWLKSATPPKAAPAGPMVAAAPTSGWTPMTKPLPDFQLADMGGKTWRLADLNGKTTLINVWATWCGPCVQELPHLQKVYEKLKDREDLVILTLNTDENPGLIEPFLKKNGFTFPVLPARTYVDEVVPSPSIPRNWIVDGRHAIRMESVGFGTGTDWEAKVVETLEKAKNMQN